MTDGTHHPVTDRRTMTQHGNPSADFVAGRARAEQVHADLRRRAARTVAGQARDSAEHATLLAMLGLPGLTARPAPLSSRLTDYVHQVAVAVGVPDEATGCEVTDTATAYLALDVRSADHDLMLVWDERLGWYVAMETTPTENPAVLAYLDGDAVPTPAAVARFVTAATSGSITTRLRPAIPPADRTELAEKMAAVCV